MKKMIFAALALLVTSVAMAQIPSVKVEDGQGKVFNTSELVDGETPMIISFWAVTCKPCIRELDAIAEQRNLQKIDRKGQQIHLQQLRLFNDQTNIRIKVDVVQCDTVDTDNVGTSIGITPHVEAGPCGSQAVKQAAHKNKPEADRQNR